MWQVNENGRFVRRSRPGERPTLRRFASAVAHQELQVNSMVVQRCADSDTGDTGAIVVRGRGATLSLSISQHSPLPSSSVTLGTLEQGVT